MPKKKIEHKKREALYPSPTFRTIAALIEISYFNEYPKNKEKFIWGIPSKYSDFRDREISALCSCWIYDFSKTSFKAAMVLDEIMCGTPYKFVWNRGFDYFIMGVDQNETLYKGIKMYDVYRMFETLHILIRRYHSLKGAFSCATKDIPYDEAHAVLSCIKEFNGKTINSQGRINLFLFMMTHCYDDYDYQSSMLQPPLFDSRILPTCKALNLIDKSIKKTELINKVSSSLAWFSKKNPMTFWVGIATYNEFVKENKNKAKKFSTMKLVRHPFKKR